MWITLTIGILAIALIFSFRKNRKELKEYMKSEKSPQRRAEEKEAKMNAFLDKILEQRKKDQS